MNQRSTGVLVSALLLVGVAVFLVYSPVAPQEWTAGQDADLRENASGDQVYVETAPSFRETSNASGLVYHDDFVSSTEGWAVAGSYVVDYDGDLREDVLTVGGERPILWRNTETGFEMSGALPAVDATVKAALFFDHDADGREDLYLLGDDRSVFLENTGDGFVERDVGLPREYESVRGAAAADYDDDGCLDVFVLQASDWRERRPEGYGSRNVSIHGDNGRPNRLFRGTCSGFEEVTEEAGITGTAWSLAASFVDFTDDGLPDLHVANDFNNDVIYVNQGDGSFDRRVLSNYTDRNGMSSEVADVDGDGLPDVFVTNVYYPERSNDSGVPENRHGGRLNGNNLLLNQGDGEFEDAAARFGVRRSEGWGWAAVLSDFSNSGDLDLYHAVADDGVESRHSFWVGRGDGFERHDGEDVGIQPGAALSTVQLDHDLDGRLDILTGVMRDRHRLYENRYAGPNALDVVLEGGGEDGLALGAVVEVQEGERVHRRFHSSRSDYQSQSSRFMHFGLRNTSTVDIVRVEWPDGEETVLHDVEARRRIQVSREGVEDSVALEPVE